MFLDKVLENLKNRKEKIAYSQGGKDYSYSDLNKYICNIYWYIISQKLNNKYVIVYGGKEVYMKSCFLACSLAGYTYIPVDKSIPKERIDEIIKQVKPALIIGDLEYEGINQISKEKINIIMNNKEFEDIENVYLQPSDIYYIIFTSGSTGVPKGVKVTYENVDSCIKWLDSILNFKNEKILNQANFSFDLSVADLYLSMINSNSQYIIDTSQMFDVGKICYDVKQSGVSCAVVTPSFIDLLLLDNEFNSNNLPNLKTIVFCGESLYKNTVEKLISRFCDIKIINCYGPTECTFAVTSMDVTKEVLKSNIIPVGKPKDDVKIYILDEEENIQKDETIGEILIAGKSVASGYLGKVTKKSFITFNNEKAYLTGDLGYIKDGLLYCVGRKDDQIKYKGYRIELSDIEQNIYKLNYIDKVKVITVNKEDGKVARIVAFVKLKEKCNKSSIEIRNDIGAFLPMYMIPNIKIIDKFDLNKNGKIDIERLREMVNGR